MSVNAGREGGGEEPQPSVEPSNRTREEKQQRNARKNTTRQKMKAAATQATKADPTYGWVRDGPGDEVGSWDEEKRGCGWCARVGVKAAGPG